MEEEIKKKNLRKMSCDLYSGFIATSEMLAWQW